MFFLWSEVRWSVNDMTSSTSMAEIYSKSMTMASRGTSELLTSLTNRDWRFFDGENWITFFASLKRAHFGGILVSFWNFEFEVRVGSSPWAKSENISRKAERSMKKLSSKSRLSIFFEAVKFPEWEMLWIERGLNVERAKNVRLELRVSSDREQNALRVRLCWKSAPSLWHSNLILSRSTPFNQRHCSGRTPNQSTLQEIESLQGICSKYEILQHDKRTLEEKNRLLESEKQRRYLTIADLEEHLQEVRTLGECEHELSLGERRLSTVIVRFLKIKMMSRMTRNSSSQVSHRGIEASGEIKRQHRQIPTRSWRCWRRRSRRIRDPRCSSGEPPNWIGKSERHSEAEHGWLGKIRTFFSPPERRYISVIIHPRNKNSVCFR